MKLLVKFFITASSFMLFTIVLRAQAINVIDKRIAKYAEQINNLPRFSENDWYEDSLENVNTKLENYLRYTCVKNAAILTDSLPYANKVNRFSVLTSADKKVRLFSWDTWKGGTMRYYSNILLYNYNDKGNVKSKSLRKLEYDYGMMGDTIIDINTKDNKAVYLVLGSSVLGGGLLAKSITAYTINNGNCIEFPFFHTSHQKLSSIGYDYNIFLYEKDNPPDIHLSEDKQSLYIPIVIEEKSIENYTVYKLTDKYLVYKFDGNKFVFDKNAQQ